jgi:hypothetical protein
MARCIPIAEVAFRTRMAWWWPVYVNTLCLFSALTGLDPSPVQVMRWWLRAIIVEVQVCGRAWERVPIRALLG